MENCKIARKRDFFRGPSTVFSEIWDLVMAIRGAQQSRETPLRKTVAAHGRGRSQGLGGLQRVSYGVLEPNETTTFGTMTANGK